MQSRFIQALIGAVLLIGSELAGAQMEWLQSLPLDDLLGRASQKLSEGHYSESEQYLRQAVTTADAGGNALARVRVRVDLAAVLFVGGRCEEAEDLLESALETLETGRYMDQSHLTVVLINLGAVYRLTGQYQNSESVLKRAKRAMDASSDRRREVDLLSNLGVLYAVTGRRKLAQSTLKEAVALEDQVGQDPVYIARTLTNLATVYYLDKKWTLAEPILIRAQQTLERSVGPMHPELSAVLNNLGFVYMAQNNFVGAEAVLRRALAIRSRAFGPDNLSVASVAMRLADALTEQDRFEEAATLYESALPVQERLSGPRSGEVALTLEHYSRMVRLKAEHEADAMESRAQSIRQEQKLLVSAKELVVAADR